MAVRSYTPERLMSPRPAVAIAPYCAEDYGEFHSYFANRDPARDGAMGVSRVLCHASPRHIWFQVDCVNGSIVEVHLQRDSMPEHHRDADLVETDTGHQEWLLLSATRATIRITDPNERTHMWGPGEYSLRDQDPESALALIRMVAKEGQAVADQENPRDSGVVIYESDDIRTDHIERVVKELRLSHPAFDLARFGRETKRLDAWETWLWKHTTMTRPAYRNPRAG
jgi:hypothetical protein